LQLRDYEIVWILGGEAGAKEGEESAERVRTLVGTLGGEVDEVNPWGKRNLAYPIEKNTEGYYVEAQLKLDATRAPELDRACNADREIIRHLIVKK
jgi:small subunit ribosomal protein S6